MKRSNTRYAALLVAIMLLLASASAVLAGGGRGGNGGGRDNDHCEDRGRDNRGGRNNDCDDDNHGGNHCDDDKNRGGRGDHNGGKDCDDDDDDNCEEVELSRRGKGDHGGHDDDDNCEEPEEPTPGTPVVTTPAPASVKVTKWTPGGKEMVLIYTPNLDFQDDVYDYGSFDVVYGNSQTFQRSAVPGVNGDISFVLNPIIGDWDIVGWAILSDGNEYPVIHGEEVFKNGVSIYRAVAYVAENEVRVAVVYEPAFGSDYLRRTFTPEPLYVLSTSAAPTK